jgi:hypothetical protein
MLLSRSYRAGQVFSSGDVRDLLDFLSSRLEDYFASLQLCVLGLMNYCSI